MKSISKFEIIQLLALVFCFCFYLPGSDLINRKTVEIMPLQKTDLMKRDPAKDQKLVLTLLNISTTLKKGEPFFVNVKIQNVSDEKFSLDYSPILYLQRSEQTERERHTLNGKNFYAGMGYPKNVEAVEKGYLEKGESIEFQEGMNSLIWLASSSSDPQDKKLAEILKTGSYDLKVRYYFADQKSSKETLYRTFESNIVVVASE